MNHHQAWHDGEAISRNPQQTGAAVRFLRLPKLLALIVNCFSFAQFVSRGVISPDYVEGGPPLGDCTESAGEERVTLGVGSQFLLDIASL